MQKNDISKPQNLEMSFIFCIFAADFSRKVYVRPRREYGMGTVWLGDD